MLTTFIPFWNMDMMVMMDMMNIINKDMDIKHRHDEHDGHNGRDGHDGLGDDVNDAHGHYGHHFNLTRRAKARCGHHSCESSAAQSCTRSSTGCCLRKFAHLVAGKKQSSVYCRGIPWQVAYSKHHGMPFMRV
jgi:hypothetical protein